MGNAKDASPICEACADTGIISRYELLWRSDRHKPVPVVPAYSKCPFCGDTAWPPAFLMKPITRHK